MIMKNNPNQTKFIRIWNRYTNKSKHWLVSHRGKLKNLVKMY